MRKIIYIIFAALSLMMVSCATKDDVAGLQQQIDQLKSGSIASIEAQASSINASISKLSSMNEELAAYTKALQGQEASLSSACDDLSKLVSSLMGEVTGQISAEKTAFLASLESYRGAANQQLATLKTGIAAMETKRSGIDSQISSLRTYVDTELKNSKDWMNTTFVTLQKYEELTSTVSGVHALISGIEQSVSALSEQCAADKEALLSSLEKVKDDFGEEAKQILQLCDGTVSALKKELAEAYTETMRQGLSDIESSLQQWVCTLLTGYYTIAQTEEKVEALRLLMESRLTTQYELLSQLQFYTCGDLGLAKQNAEAISAVQEALVSNDSDASAIRDAIMAAKQSLKNDYESLISSAIHEKGGKLDAALQDSLTLIHAELDGAVADMKSSLQTMQSRIRNCEDEIASLTEEIRKVSTMLEQLFSRIQSFVVVPSYIDGSVAVQNGPTEIYFEVNPKDVAEALSKVSAAKFSLSVVSGEASASLPVSSVTFDGTLFCVNVNCAALYQYSGQLKAQLKVSDTTYPWSTAYFTLTLD